MQRRYLTYAAPSPRCLCSHIVAWRRKHDPQPDDVDTDSRDSDRRPVSPARSRIPLTSVLMIRRLTLTTSPTGPTSPSTSSTSLSL